MKTERIICNCIAVCFPEAALDAPVRATGPQTMMNP
ncbi:hypothetical protein SB6415_01931 [Klebsiella pasteurii]|uniref:Uncharacterized protein n=1 Tax=Klebsiella pasteurii TaxID=2587529 RepID=A0A9Q9S421_9ENTR|nr:hypothetical protein HMPREF9694_04705 [Klebsiella michiganensis]VUS23487.1 hypothetical protein SB6410_00450 [Klebsiella pasteurii]VUS51414.1 hypothetical protein SPARK1531C2_01521 [Klebsiella grimontii]VUS32117.1 hypothetical protein SB6407_00803 [Klebsiella pasteurii]VUS32525.1 hypothetical protein SB6414_00842 [Klebsiella pasteurii]